MVFTNHMITYLKKNIIKINIQNFKLDTFINYEHSHVSRYDQGIETRLNIHDGVLYFICKPNSYKMETIFIKNNEFNKNHEIMKLYYNISEKCIFINLNIFIRTQIQRD